MHLPAPSARFSAIIGKIPCQGSIARRTFSHHHHAPYHPPLSASPLTVGDIEKLKVDKNRLMEDLHHTCSWGTGKKWGRHAIFTSSP